MKRITDIATISVVVLLMLVAALVYLGPRFGLRADNIVSGSMEPTIPQGAMIVAENVQPAELKIGDIITFKPVGVGEKAICHRIVDIKQVTGLLFTTKGDAYAEPDPFTVPAANVVGKVVFSTPVVGYFIQFLRTPYGLLIALVLPALVVIWLIFRVFWKELIRYIRSSPPKEG